MKRTILLTAVLLTTISVGAQNFGSRATFWLKPEKVRNTKSALNKNAILNGNTNQALTAPIGAGQSNVYFVFKSEDEGEKELMNYTFTCTQHSVTTQTINYPDPVAKELKRRTGAIVRYNFNYPNATGDKNYVTVIDQPNDLTNIYEVIYVNDAFTELDHKKIQSYLTVKYGISLVNPANYVDSNGNQTWNNQLNTNYNNFITGVGRSDYFGLNKLETTNSIDNRLTISSEGFADNEFVFFGTNNQNTNFKADNGVELLDSSWLVQTNQKPAVTTLRFNLDQPKTTGTYQLLINQNNSSFTNNESVLRVEGKVEGNQIVFENVVFDTDGNGYDTFTIAYATQAKQTTKPEVVINKGAKVNAFPNPANINETVSVTYDFGKPTDLNIHVFTLDRKLVSKKEVNNVENYVFDTQFTSNGIYLIVSTYNGEVTTSRIVVK